MNKHLERKPELQRLADRLGEIYDEIQIIDAHGDLIKTGDEQADRRIRLAEDELWAQYRGIQAYMQFCFPLDAKCCLILAAGIMSRLEDIKCNEMDEEELLATAGEMDRLLQSLIAGLEHETGCTLADLGLKAFFPENINDARRAVGVVSEIQAKQYQQAKDAGIVDIVKADARYENGQRETESPSVARKKEPEPADG